MSIITMLLSLSSCQAQNKGYKDLDRLSFATKEAHKQGLKVLFNPWKMEADSATIQ